MIHRFALCLWRNRIAPRYDKAESLLLVDEQEQGRLGREVLAIGRMKPEDVCAMLMQQQVSTLICGGVTDECRARLGRFGVKILDNVIGSADGAIAAYLQGRLTAGAEVD